MGIVIILRKNNHCIGQHRCVPAGYTVGGSKYPHKTARAGARGILREKHLIKMNEED